MRRPFAFVLSRTSAVGIRGPAYRFVCLESGAERTGEGRCLDVGDVHVPGVICALSHHTGGGTGAGRALMRADFQNASTPRVLVSTNESNKPIRDLPRS